MHFQIIPVPNTPFEPLYGLDDAALAALGVVRRRADAQPGYPCRLALADAAPGTSLLLLEYRHQAAGPYSASGPIYVGEHAVPATPAVDEWPAMLARRPLSIRAYDGRDGLRDADLADGEVAQRALLARLLAHPDTAYLQVHFARYGCYVCRVERVDG